MNISISHSTSFDFETELYTPIKKSFRLRKHNFFFPEDIVKNTRDVIKSCTNLFQDLGEGKDLNLTVHNFENRLYSILKRKKRRNIARY